VLYYQHRSPEIGKEIFVSLEGITSNGKHTLFVLDIKKEAKASLIMILLRDLESDLQANQNTVAGNMNIFSNII